MIAIEQWQLIKDLFAEVLEIDSVRREAHLLKASLDAEVAEEVRHLLRLEIAVREKSFLAIPFAPAVHQKLAGLQSGQLVDQRYLVLGTVGLGGMGGGAYEVLDTANGDKAALKVTTDQREYSLMRTIDHPNVCKALDYGELDGNAYFTMELLDGQTLEEHLDEKGALEDEELASFLEPFTEGVTAIHEAGIVHGDLKPANVMLTASKRVVILDFGLAWFVDESLCEGLRPPSAGTVPYLAPEVLRGRAPTVRSDLYAMAVVLFEAATGFPLVEHCTPPRNLPAGLAECLDINPAARPISVKAALNR